MLFLDRTQLLYMASTTPYMDILLCLGASLFANNFSLIPKLPTTFPKIMHSQPDTPKTPAIEQNGPETNEYVAPTPFSWQPWQVEILKKNLPSYKTTKSVRGCTSILDKVLKKFKSRTAVSDNDLGDLRKVCNRCCQ